MMHIAVMHTRGIHDDAVA